MKPLILITNDDGVFSPGLKAAVEAVIDLGEILICAPITQQTAMGRAFPRTPDLGIVEEVELKLGDKRVTAYGVHGSPAYAVAHGVMELAERMPDFCISGINYGENLGRILTCSGTVGAILEADSYGIPGIAVSAQIDYRVQRNSDYPKYQWEGAKKAVRDWTENFLTCGMPEGVNYYNINLPEVMGAEPAYRITRLSRQNYYVFQKPEPRDLSKPYQLQAKLQVDESKLDKNSDIYAIYVDKVISVTPMTWDMSVDLKPLRS